MEQKANVQLEAQLDNNNFDESDLISLKVPAEHINSYVKSNHFERVNGQVEINGVLYKYVKRRLFNDSLEFLCIPNNQVMSLQNAKDDFFKLVNDLQHTGQGKKTDNHSGSKTFSIDYYTAVQSLFQVGRPSEAVLHGSSRYAETLSFYYTLTAEQPPEHC